MEVKQIYNFVNEAQKEVLGETAIVTEDLSNIVDVGSKLEDLESGYEKFYHALANRIGRMLFVNRPYTAKYRKMFRESWEFGSIMGKIQAELLEAQEDPSFEIVNGASYDPYVVNLPVVSAKFWNMMDAFQIPLTTPIDQIKQSFKSRDEMVRFTSMLETMINNSQELKLEILASRTINNLMAVTYNAGGAKVINLVSEYNTTARTSLTADSALINTEFLRYATARIIEMKAYLADYSTLYNIGGKARFTPSDRLHFEVFSTFASRCKTHLGSNTFHEELVKLPYYEEVPAWQGSGTSGSNADRMKLEVTAVDDEKNEISVSATNIVGVMFDHDGCGVLQPERKVTANYNPNGDYTNQFYKSRTRYFNDFNENCILFTLN